jgi:hypothetical protein
MVAHVPRSNPADQAAMQAKAHARINAALPCSAALTLTRFFTVCFGLGRSLNSHASDTPLLILSPSREAHKV